MPVSHQNKRAFGLEKTRGRPDEVLPKSHVRRPACVEWGVHDNPIQTARHTPSRGISPMEGDAVVLQIKARTVQCATIRLDQIDVSDARQIQEVPGQIPPSSSQIRTAPLQ